MYTYLIGRSDFLLSVGWGFFLSKSFNAKMVFLSSVKQHVVRKFLGLTSGHNIPVYLIDPLILGLVDKDIEQIRSSPGGPSPECKYFCAPRDFTTFALLDKTWKHEVSACSRLCILMHSAVL